jgi:hypothetical protein
MAGRPKGKKAKVTRQKVKFDPFGFDKVMKEFMARPKEQRKLDKKEVQPRPTQGPPPPPKKRGRPKGSKNKPVKVRLPIRSSKLGRPKKIVVPTGRDMDDTIIKIQQQFLIDKKKLKKKTGGYTVTNRYSDIMLPEKKRTTRIT